MSDDDATETDAHDVTQATGVPADGGPSGTEAEGSDDAKAESSDVGSDDATAESGSGSSDTESDDAKAESSSGSSDTESPDDGGADAGGSADATAEDAEDGDEEPTASGSDGAGGNDAEGSATEARPATSQGDDDPAPKAEGTGEFDVGAAEARLEEVEKEIEQGRQALADVSQEVEPEPDGPPVAAGEGAANAPPG